VSGYLISTICLAVYTQYQRVTDGHYYINVAC